METPRVQSLSLTLATPGVVSVPMGRPAVRTRSYLFPTPFEPITPSGPNTSPGTPSSDESSHDHPGPHESEHERESTGGSESTGGTVPGKTNHENIADTEIAKNTEESSDTQKSDTRDTRNSPTMAPWEDGVQENFVVLSGSTRVRPPRDVIRLEDRLRYLLQPSLQQVFASRALTCPFRPFAYQFEGTAFLYAREIALLADEMGLGKTMQAILAVRLLLHAGELRSVLLICPKPLVSNWYREFSIWAPEIPIQVIEGDQTKRHWMWRLENVPVRIANYELVTRDREVFESEDEDDPAAMYAGAFHAVADRHPPKRKKRKRPDVFRQPGDDHGTPIRPVGFDLVILDESQRIRNRGNTTSRVVRKIRRHRSWALTGTPVENSSDDLLGIFEFLSPGFLTPEMSPRRMGEAVRDCVIRRTKEQVLTEMPPKLYRDATLELLPEQKESYTRATDEGVIQLTDMGDSVTIHHVLELVLRLKQICNFDPRTGASVKAERLEADLEEIAGSGRKALVFSQWVETLERLGETLHRFHPLQY
ncbi:MAG: DEAD/DEAH box helicase, partial [Planctomycetia bacterium]|nr:DEAD/DEAH box helicase [Planctomycetia bacterium]